MNSKKCFSNFPFLFSIFLSFNCLSYWNNEIIKSNKPINREKGEIKSTFNINPVIKNKAVQFYITETINSFEKVKYQKEVVIEKKILQNGHYNYGNPDLPKTCGSIFWYNDPNPKCYSYWGQVLGWPLMIFGIPYLWTIPIAIFDWTTLPIRTLFDDRKTYFEEKSELVNTKVGIPKTKTFLKLENNEESAPQKYEVLNGVVSIPFSKISNPVLLLKSNNENRNYQYSLERDGEILLTNEFIGESLKESKEFLNLIYERDKKEYNRCLKRFTYPSLKEGRNCLVPNTGLSSSKYCETKEWIILLKSVCGKYLGTDQESVCTSDFSNCVDKVRNFDNKNLKYEKE